MNKKSFFVLTGIFTFLYIFNYLQPLSFGDDYLYSFVWQGQAMFVPLTEDAVKVSSWHSLLVSQCSLYFTWGGRVIGQTLTQFFIWAGKDIFNIFNALIGTVLVAEIYWCANKGKVSLDFKPERLCWIFFALWAFSFGFSTVFLWLTGACIYLWPTVFLLLFLIPYIQKYYNLDITKEKNSLFTLKMFILGVIAGCGNENSVCWSILLLLCFLYVNRKHYSKETWMYAGLIGLLTGYALLMLAPGNVARFHSEQYTDILTLQSFKNKLYIFTLTLTFQFFLWYLSLKSLYILRKIDLQKQAIKKDIILVKALCMIAFGMSAIMFFSPFFPPRSSFPGTVQLIIAATILLRMQKENNIILIHAGARRFLFEIGVLFFIITASTTFKCNYENKEQMDTIIHLARQAKESSVNTVLTVKPFKKSGSIKDFLSGYHLSYFDLPEDESNWVNVAFSRYYGIKGIRMIKDKNNMENK